MVFSSLAVVADLSESSTHRGSRGVEKMSSDGNVLHAKRIARQQCRARIETSHRAALQSARFCIARQQCRARIETTQLIDRAAEKAASPGSNAGRGLKRC